MSEERIKPMLAEKAKAPIDTFQSGLWVAEEKFDGHRALLFVERRVAGNVTVTLRSRSWKLKKMSDGFQAAAKRLPSGIFDGELCAADAEGRSWNVPTAINDGNERYIVFDVIALAGENTESLSLRARRKLLEEALQGRTNGRIQLSRQAKPSQALLDEIYDRGGEGVILKRLDSPYQRCRSDAWLKIKMRQEAELEVIDLEEGTRPGLLTIAKIRDREGNITSVKVRNEDYVAEINRNPEKIKGRWMEIEYQVRTPDGNYRHPMMKRWVGEED